MNESLEEFERRAKITTDDFEGIISYLEVFHLTSILYSAERGIESFAQYDELAKSDASAATLISSVQEAIVHAAAVSRYFWPSPMGKKKEPEFKKMKMARGVRLREAYGLDETSPLFDRELRNCWEHFDERLDRYCLEILAGEYFPDPILGSHELTDNPVQYFLKLLDVDAHCLVLLGAKHFFQDIRESLVDVAEKSKKFIDDGGRIRYPT